MDRYSRQSELVAQDNLKNAKVMIAGVGGLGASVSALLAMAGIGELVLVDKDKVEISNLNRQILYHEEDVGKMKVDVAKERLNEINNEVKIRAMREKIEEGFKIPEDVDIVVDGLDNYETRFIVEKACIENGIPYVFGAVEGYMGMVSFIDKSTKRLRDIMHKTRTAEAQVLGATVMMTASIQSMEVLKYISKKGDLLRNRLLVYDGLSSNFLEVSV